MIAIIIYFYKTMSELKPNGNPQTPKVLLTLHYRSLYKHHHFMYSCLYKVPL